VRSTHGYDGSNGVSPVIRLRADVARSHVKALDLLTPDDRQVSAQAANGIYARFP
jgi:hypothetical protein